MRKIALIVTIIITVVAGLFYAIAKNSKDQIALNEVKPYKISKSQADILETIDIEDKISIYEFKVDKLSDELSVSVDLYNKGELVKNLGGLSYKFEGKSQSKTGEIILNNSNDIWGILFNENGTRAKSSCKMGDNLKQYIAEYDSYDYSFSSLNKAKSIIKNEDIILNITVFAKDGFSNFDTIDFENNSNKLKEYDWAVITKLIVK